MFIQRKSGKKLFFFVGGSNSFLEQKTIWRGIRPWWGGNCCIQHVPDKSQEELLAAECWSNRSEQLTSARVEPQTFVLENSQLYCQRANGWNEDMGERFNKKIVLSGWVSENFYTWGTWVSSQNVFLNLSLTWIFVEKGTKE